MKFLEKSHDIEGECDLSLGNVRELDAAVNEELSRLVLSSRLSMFLSYIVNRPA